MTDMPRRIEVALQEEAAKEIRKLQLRAWQALTSATPVQTGFARSGWTPTAGSPAANRLNRPSDLSAARSIAKTQRAANEARALHLAVSYGLDDGKVFLVNNVSYIVPLNMGTSSQAPAKFVERAIDKAVRSLGL